ncbi:MAG: 3-phosphoshikimate 1-carboxyvinyltransferase [Acidobacteriota bacterium]
MSLPDPYPVPAGRIARGRLRPPASKSVSQRLLDLALVLDAEHVRLDNLLFSDDIEHFLGGLAAFGLRVERSDGGVDLHRGEQDGEAFLDCGAGGTMLRFLVAAAAVRKGSSVLDGTPRLRERTVAPLVEALRALGVRIEYLAEEGFCPLRIRGGTLGGGRCSLDASLSSQYLSALLMACLRAREPVDLQVTGMTSAPYVELTLAALADFGVAEAVQRTERGYRIDPAAAASPPAGLRLQVEADDSAVAYPAAAALLTDGDVVLEGLRPDSIQGDRRLLALLESVGARLEWTEDQLRVTRRLEVLRPFDVDMSEIPDQVPTLAAIAPFCDGVSRIRNVPHLRIKESDRLAAMADGLSRCGFSVEEQPDGLVLEGRGEALPVSSTAVLVDSYEDHRIAMSMALVGLRRPGLQVADPSVVAKSYPNFWQHLEQLLET